MSKQTLNEFVYDNFNDDTIDTQILAQQRIISNAEQEIKRLAEIREDQSSKPWYQRDGVTFIHEGWNHSNGYCSDQDCNDTFIKYEDFVAVIIKITDRSIYCLRPDHSEFIIVAPGQDDYNLRHEEVSSLPIVKEYYERKELRKKIAEYKKMLESIESFLGDLESKIQMSEKYTEAFIRTLHEKKSETTIQRDNLIEEIEKGETAKRLIELDQFLISNNLKI